MSENVDDMIFRRMLNIQNICFEKTISDKEFRYRVEMEVRDLLSDVQNAMENPQPKEED